MKKGKRFFALALCMAILASATACSGGETANSETESSSVSSSESSSGSDGNTVSSLPDEGITYSAPGEWPLSDETIEISIMANMDTTGERSENLQTKEMEEMMGIKINWTLTQSGSFREKMNLMFAGDDYVDIIAPGVGNTDRLDKVTESQLGSQGLIIPLEDYIDTVSVGFKAAMENPELEGMREYMTTPDGHIYSLPVIDGYLQAQYQNKMWINTTWLDNLGLEMPTTTEEYYQVLKAFKEQDPNGNGLDDEIPLSSCVSTSGTEFDCFLMSAFILTPSNRQQKMWVDNGTIVFSPMQEEYREGLRYLNKLYSEGLINPESFTQDMNTQINTNENGDVPVIGSFLATRPGYACDLKTIPNSKKWEQYEMLPPLSSETQEAVATWNPYVMFNTGTAAITNACEHPQAAFRMLDWLATEEGTVRSSRGIEGVQWKASEPGEVGMDGTTQAKWTEIEGAPTDGQMWGQLTSIVNTPTMVLEIAMNPDPYAEGVPPLTGRQIVLYKGSKEYEKVRQPMESVLPDLYFSESDAEEIALLKTTILDYVNESVVRFITGDLSVDNDWDSYLEELHVLDVDRYLEMMQNAYDQSGFKK